jgi:peptidoglycan-associated lipoprotein
MTMNVNKTLAFLTFIFLSYTLVAQPMSRIYREANKMFSDENYCEAADKCANAYKQLTRKGKKAIKYKGDMAFKTAECYRYTEHVKDAEEWYNRAILLDYQEVNPKVYLHDASMLQQMGEFKKSIEILNLYKKMVPNDILADVRIQSCKSAADFKSEKTRYVVDNQRSINKPSFDMAPVFGDRKESKLFFSSSRAGSTGSGTDPRSCENYMDIWVSQTDKKGNWGEPTLLEGEGINTEENEGTVCFDGRNKTMFFTRCPLEKKMNLGCDIWMSEAKGRDEWKEPTKVVLKSSDSVSVGHPCASEDGRTLVFASDMAGGSGGIDLWISNYDRRSDSWSGPINLGPEINTSGNDMFPTFAKNGDLFFSSDGHPGLGNLDVFRATKVVEEFKWENAQNMGSPINSEAADYALYELNEIKGYFTSERKGENGEFKGDIYSYELPPNLFDLRLSVSELGNRSEIVSNTKVVVTGSDGSAWEGYTNDKGKISWDKKPNGDRYIKQDVSYIIKISKEGFHEDTRGSKFTTVGFTQGQTILLDMSLLPKKPIRLPEVRYPFGTATLLVDNSINSKDSLNFVLDMLTEYPGMVLELSSHTDARGSDAANQKLSEARAKTCVDYLVKEKGVDPRRLRAVGKGEREPATWKDPINGNSITLTEVFINQFKTTDKEKFEMLHQINRRTEGRVLSMDFIK